jgi:hypothetical protein
MTSRYDSATERWIVTSGCVTVKGPSRSACEERLREMEEKLRQIEAERLAQLLWLS